jgi:hypothetical protein
MRGKFKSFKLKTTGRLEDQGIDGRIMLRQILKN